MTTFGRQEPRWWRSFYWRVSVGFVLFVIGVVLAQGLIFSYAMSRPTGPFQPRSPREYAANVASSLEVALAENPSLDVEEFLRGHFSRPPLNVGVVMQGGGVIALGRNPWSERTKRLAQDLMNDARMWTPQPPESPQPGADRGPGMDRGPVMTSPVMVGGVVKGLVVMPPPGDPGPPPNFFLQDLGRVLSLPGTGVLLTATALAAFFVFGPARRRLRALEEATDRLGAGDLAARAPEGGGDEIARVAWSFNRMARELAAREEAVRESDRLRRQMFADVSHELKTPLTAIRGYLETLRMTELALDPATRDRYLVTAERETMRLDRLVRDLVDLARFENAIVSLNVRPCDVHRLIGLVVERYEGEAQRSQIAFQANIADSVDQWTIDPNRIDQALDNLVANALRHTPTGGSVTIDARATATEGVLEVTDSGEGIPQEHLPYIFDRFYKADAARSGGPSRGSGLGLSIVKAIVERHGGTIQVSSRPGRTCFTITLPI